MKKYRIETDSIGSLEVPKNAYYGVQSLRGKNNFHITGYRLHPKFITAMAYVKKAAALSNYHAGVISKEIQDAMIQASEEIIEGKFRDQFITDAIQGGAGTSMNMNINEVIANRGGELLGG
ncbi:MAG: lyase family protein, partial [Fusobacteriaceae bacterium]